MKTVFEQKDDLISRSTLIEGLKERLQEQSSQNVQAKRILHDQVAMAIEAVEAAPAVDAEPVRHGRWIRMDDTFTRWKCSECGAIESYSGLAYCHCGAKMNGGDQP